jgi:hypothetical protein
LLLIAGLPFFLVFLFAPSALAGSFCAGQRDWVEFKMELLAGSSDNLAQGLIAGMNEAKATGFFSALTFAGWLLWQDSRQRVLDDLAQRPEIDQETLRASLRPLWLKANDLSIWRGTSRPDVEAGLETIIEEFPEAWLLCQAIQSGSSSRCFASESLSQIRADHCAKETLRLGLLFKGRCDLRMLQESAGAQHKSAEDLRSYCEVLGQQKPERCEQFQGAPREELVLCRAFAGNGEPGCLEPEMPPDKVERCRRQVRQFRYVRRLAPAWEIPDQDANALDLLALEAARSDRPDCSDLLLGYYDRLSAPAFDLR